MQRLRGLLSLPERERAANDELRLLIGTQLAQALAEKHSYERLADLEFRVFSQFGDDGIIQYLAANLDLHHRTFIEFGVEDYLESNTRFLLQKDNWTGFVMDGSEACMQRVRGAPFYWKHDLTAVTAFVTRENIRELIARHTGDWPAVDLLHIDVDGNDFWIWEAIDIIPSVVVVEYNSVFGPQRAITVPYDPVFERAKAHFSHLYWGSSLKALCLLARRKGYAFVGSNDAGNNAYFVRRDKLNERVREVSLEDGYVASRYRESRDVAGNLSFLRGAARAEAIRGMPVHDIEADKIVPF